MRFSVGSTLQANSQLLWTRTVFFLQVLHAYRGGEKMEECTRKKRKKKRQLEPLRRLVATSTALEETFGRNGSSAAQQGLRSTDKAPSAAWIWRGFNIAYANCFFPWQPILFFIWWGLVVARESYFVGLVPSIFLFNS